MMKLENETDKLRTLICREHTLELGRRTLIMGILNVTPDSFSDGGKYVTVEAALQQARRMIAEGADIIDVGGESTRPGSSKVSLDEELSRVLPIIKALSQEIDIPISIDTYKAEVAKQALDAGVHIINDIWGFKGDVRMAEIAADYGCPVVVMHNRLEAKYNNLIPDIISDLKECIQIGLAAGVNKEQIILDPGIGFGKKHEDNLQVMHDLKSLTSLGYPVLLGTSRKTFIRNTLHLPADDVVEGTGATVALGIAHGCEIVRVHDVLAMKRVAVMMDAMVRRAT